jgi:quinol monooxygenase YgiN
MESDTLRAEGRGPDSNSVVALDKEVPVILVVGRVRSPAEKRDALVALMEKMQDESRREKGCIRYGFFAAVEDPLGFIAVEEWADREALDRHFAEPHLLEFASGLLELVSERPEVAIHEVAETSAFPGAS